MSFYIFYVQKGDTRTDLSIQTQAGKQNETFITCDKGMKETSSS